MGDSEITKDPTQKQDQTLPQQESSLGREYIGLGGVLAIMAYLVLFTAADLYVVVKVWPPAPKTTVIVTTIATPTPTPQSTSVPAPSSSPAASPVPSPSPSPAGNDKQGAASPSAGTDGKQKPAVTSEQDQGPWPVGFFWGDCYVSLNVALFLIVIFCGAMGALVRALRSFFWYLGMRELKWSWAAMYILLPFVGALIAVVFYLIIRGGLSSTAANITSAYGYAAIGALVGLFSDQAILQLKQIADKIFTKPEQGKDAAPPQSTAAPKISKVLPPTGSPAGGTPVTIAGDNFRAAAKVNFGGTPATSVVVKDPGSITANTPAHAAGTVDVEVVNPDNQKATLANGFTYQ